MKRSLSLAIAIFCSSVAFAQFSMGLVIGPSFTTQRWSSNAELFTGTKTRTQFHLGLTSDIPVAARFSIQPELMFSYQGWKNTQELTNLINDYTYNIGYLKMPVLATYNHEYDNALGIIGIGPYISGVALTNQTYLQNNNNLRSGKLRLGTTKDDELTKADYGLKAKAGFLLKSGLGITAGYDFGLKDINPTMVKTYNRMFTVSLNYLFRLGKEDQFQRFSDSYKW
jgi:outer membrane immunogenic protein